MAFTDQSLGEKVGEFRWDSCPRTTKGQEGSEQQDNGGKTELRTRNIRDVMPPRMPVRRATNDDENNM